MQSEFLDVKQMKTFFLTVSSCLLISVHALGQIDAIKGDSFTLMVPLSVLYEDGICVSCSGWGGDPIPILSADIYPETNWTGQLPLMTELRFEKLKTKKKYVEAELRNNSVAIKLRFYTDSTSVQAEFDRVVSYGDNDSVDTQSRLAAIYKNMATSVFQGPLNAVPPDLQHGLLAYTHQTLGGAGLSHIKFRRGDYLVVDLGMDSSVYNTNQLNQSQRVARILNDRLLVRLKQISAVLDGTGLTGVRLDLFIPHRDFLSDLPPDADSLMLYALASDAQAFSDFEITNQQFIDACVIIVNDNRIEVRLTDD